MQPDTIALVRDSFAQVRPIATQAAGLFYQRLFEIDPTTRPLFRSTDMAAQGAKLMATLGFVTAALDKLDQLIPAAEALARRHVGYGVTSAQYDTVGQALLWTLEQGLGEAFTPAVKAAWVEAYTTLAGVMIAASEQAQAA